MTRRPTWRAAASRLAGRPTPARPGEAVDVRLAVRAAYLAHRQLVIERRPLPALHEVGSSVFSQNDEDGILLFLLAVVGLMAPTGRLIDIGAGDGVFASNSANLLLHLGFHGLLLEGDAQQSEQCRTFYASAPATKQFPPVSTCAFVTRENVDALVSDAGPAGDVDLLSVIVDGNDYWIWDALTVATPSIVLLETHTEHGDDDVLAPYDPAFDWRLAPPGTPLGASPVAAVRMAAQKGYRLVGGSRYGYNAFFLRQGVAEDLVPTVPPEALLQHPWSAAP